MLAAHEPALPLRYMVLDIDPQGSEELGTDFKGLGDVPIHDLIAAFTTNPAAHPGHEHLGPLDRLKRAVGATRRLDKGGQGGRALSLTALLWYLLKRPNDFMQELLQPVLDLLSTVVGQGETGAEFVHPATQRLLPVTIIQVASAAGSVGSGLAMTVADLYHTAFRQGGIKDGQLQLNLLLPECFDHTSPQLKANTWAFLAGDDGPLSKPAASTLQFGGSDP